MNPRIVDLMIKLATEGLTDAEQLELEQLGLPDPVESERIEAAVAAIDLACLSDSAVDSNQPVPPQLRKRVLADADEFFKGPGKSHDAVLDDAASDSARIQPRSIGAAGTIGSPVTRREITAMVIAAACLLLVFSGWNPLGESFWQPDSTPPTAQADSDPTVTQQWAAFMARDVSDRIELPWVPVDDKDVSGMVVWSDAEQEGYMVFSGLDPNDPQQEQYQLWIFDTEYEQPHPVDGGVFDITAQSARNERGQVLIPIDARIPIDKAVRFAITVEDPGGVVVSDRNAIPTQAGILQKPDLAIAP